MFRQLDIWCLNKIKNKKKLKSGTKKNSERIFKKKRIKNPNSLFVVNLGKLINTHSCQNRTCGNPCPRRDCPAIRARSM